MNLPQAISKYNQIALMEKKPVIRNIKDLARRIERKNGLKSVNVYSILLKLKKEDNPKKSNEVRTIIIYAIESILGFKISD